MNSVNFSAFFLKIVKHSEWWNFDFGRFVLLFEGILIMLVYLRCLTGFPTSLGGREYQGCSFFAEPLFPYKIYYCRHCLLHWFSKSHLPFNWASSRGWIFICWLTAFLFSILSYFMLVITWFTSTVNIDWKYSEQ